MNDHPKMTAVALLVGLSAIGSSQPVFTGLGTLSGGNDSFATAMSGDGTVVVGASTSSSGLRGFRWTSSSGMVSIGTLPGHNESNGMGVSRDGTVVTGTSQTVPNVNSRRAYRWTSATGMVDTGLLPGGQYSAAYNVSGNGFTIVGFNAVAGNSHATKWQNGTGHVDLLTLPGHGWATATCVSFDGSVVAGNSSSGTDRAVRWAPTAAEDLGALPGGSFSNVWDINNDGTIIVGRADSLLGQRAYKWTYGVGMQDLGALPGATYTDAFAVSDNGQVVGGECTIPGGNRAFIWTPTLGITDFTNYATSRGINLNGWILTRVNDVSADGNSMCGWADTPNGRRAWVIRGLFPTSNSFQLAVATSTVVGGVLTSGTITFDQAGATPRSVRMTDNSTAVLMSSYCTVPAGQIGATFNIYTYGVSVNTVATISAYHSGVTRTANLTLTPASLSLLKLSPPYATAGNATIGVVYLDGRAPSTGAKVNLYSTNPTIASSASSVTIAYGAGYQKFPVSTFGVDATTNVVISASRAGITKTASLSVRPAILTSLSLPVSSTTGGASLVATVGLNGKTGPSGRTVLLTSNRASIIVPVSMYVPPQKASWTFNLNTTPVATSTTGTIIATQGSHTASVTLTVNP